MKSKPFTGLDSQERLPSRCISDDFGTVEIPGDAFWGPQTQRSLQHFSIGRQRFRLDLIEALVHIKRACAQVNHNGALLETRHYQAIVEACDALLKGHCQDQFPLSVWQTGSGTQTNMNVNEVISYLANQWLSHQHGKVTNVHPNDHVNQSQSTNDVFPSAMHIATVQATHSGLFPALKELEQELSVKQQAFQEIACVGRTHLMDALPLTVGDILSAFLAQLQLAREAIQSSLDGLYLLALGGTAVGRGHNAPEAFGPAVTAVLATVYGMPFRAHSNLFAAVSGQDALVRYSAALKQLATVLFKVANDFRLLGSGPRCGFNEWRLPANEAGSSMMPGKVNPTQCEALSMVCIQVFGNDLAVSLGAAHGQLQLNVYRPLMIHNVLESIELLSDSMRAFARWCVHEMQLNEPVLAKHLRDNLAMVTLIAPEIGYEAAANIARYAYTNDCSLAMAADQLGVCSESAFEHLLQPFLNGQRNT